MPAVTLCADDYALAPGISRACLELAEAGKLSAVSCMALSPHWPEHARWLLPLHGRVEVGLHFTLTELAPLGPMPRLAPAGRLPTLGRLLPLALARRLDRAEVAAELARQLERFIAAFGRMPDFIDGHQHVHTLPGVREAVAALWDGAPAGGRRWLRVCWEPPAAIMRRGVAPVKALVIAALSWRLRQLARQRGIPANDSFRGVYDFSRRVAYGELFPRFLAGAGERPLVMCHPGLAEQGADEPEAMRQARLAEYRYLRDVAPRVEAPLPPPPPLW